MKSLRDATCAGFRDSIVFATLPGELPGEMLVMERMKQLRATAWDSTGSPRP
jgi:hypothetical protein